MKAKFYTTIFFNYNFKAYKWNVQNLQSAPQ